jgi:photosystem II protein PsbQ
MASLRSILSVILVLVATLLVGCSGPSAKIPTTYTPEKIAQIQLYAAPIEEARESLSTLEKSIQEENWVNTRTFIHGPLGGLRKSMANLSNSLLKKDQAKATELAKEIFGHLERLDAAAQDRSPTLVELQYREALKDFDAYLNLIPKAS